MATQKPSTDTYVLGQAPEAIQRLLKQGRLLNPFTRRVLEARVSDLRVIRRHAARPAADAGKVRHRQ